MSDLSISDDVSKDEIAYSAGCEILVEGLEVELIICAKPRNENGTTEVLYTIKYYLLEGSIFRFHATT